MSAIVEHVGPDGEVSRLPAGEHVVWSGAPDRRALARFFLRERWVLAFVLFSFALGAADALQHADGAMPRLMGVATLSAIMLSVAIVSIRVFAWQLARSSRYVITNRRMYFNIGIVMRADANIPFSSVETVDLRRRSDGSADLMITLTERQEIPWLLLFPHMTWRGSRRGRPTFRSLRAPEQAAEAVVAALRTYTQPPSSEVSTASAAIVPPGPRAMSGAVTPSPA
jgi:Bacterial PH domain